jgi:cellulose synthase/poly-beta-1,6-N-acetylglucosamine synthase-like glycosyltransferase
MQWLAAILVLPYFFILLHIFRGVRKLKPFRSENQGNLYISVIIACRNEEDNLPYLLAGLQAQSYPAGLFEIIIIDDNSSDNSWSVAESLKESVNNLRLIRNTGSGKKAAIRTGIIAAKGSYIATTDADCRMGPDWLQTISSFVSETKADLVISPVIMKGANKIHSKLAETEFLALQGITAGTAANGDATMCNGANLAFRKELYLANLENINPGIQSGDDIFLLHSAKKDKKALIKWLESGNAAVKTNAPASFFKLMQQRKRWLSKASAYKDRSTIILGIVTFVTILLQPVLLATISFSYTYLYIYLVVLLLKSIPDYLILSSVAGRYNIKGIWQWFIPLQVIYPFYVLIVAAAAFAVPAGKTSSPSQTGT